MKEEQLEELLKDPILPFPWQGGDREYPEYEKYGELWETAQHSTGRAKDYVESYNRFVIELKKLMAKNNNL